MELLIAMMAGALGGVLATRGLLPCALPRAPATLIGIAGGAAGYIALAAVGPGYEAGPLVIGHLIVGGASGGALAALTGLLWRRISG